MSNGTLIYLSLGSNLGDRSENLNRAIAALPEAGVRVLRQSSLYETEPVDFLEQPWFLNCVVEGETSLEPALLLHALQGIEKRQRSKKLVPRGPRVIDLDVLYYGASVIRTAEVQIPHPRLANRRFVLVPLAELAPDWRDPTNGTSVAKLLAETTDKSIVRPWQPPCP